MYSGGISCWPPQPRGQDLLPLLVVRPAQAAGLRPGLIPLSRVPLAPAKRPSAPASLPPAPTDLPPAPANLSRALGSVLVHRLSATMVAPARLPSDPGFVCRGLLQGVQTC